LLGWSSKRRSKDLEAGHRHASIASKAKLCRWAALGRPPRPACGDSNAFFTAFGGECKNRPGNRFGKGNGIFLC
jgi:hypothetical protein